MHDERLNPPVPMLPAANLVPFWTHKSLQN